MAVDLQKLSGIAPPGELPRETIEWLARSWTSHQLQAGEILWKQGERANNLGLLYSGELQVVVDAQDIGTIRPGQLFGEATAFAPNAQRSATLQAVFPSEVLLIENSSLSQLRQEVPSFYDRLLNRALEEMARRIRVTDHVISNLSPGDSRLPRHGPGDLQRLRRYFRKIAAISKPRCKPLLESLPLLGSISDAALDELAAAFHPEPFERGQVITREGEEGNSAFLVGSGSVRALRSVERAGSEELVVFEQGDLFGLISLVSPGKRTASCIGKESGWLFAIDHRAYRALPTGVRLVWKECLASLMSVELRIANELVARFLDGRSTGPVEGDALRELVQAAGINTDSSGGA